VLLPRATILQTMAHVAMQDKTVQTTLVPLTLTSQILQQLAQSASVPLAKILSAVWRGLLVTRFWQCKMPHVEQAQCQSRLPRPRIAQAMRAQPTMRLSVAVLQKNAPVTGTVLVLRWSWFLIMPHLIA
jgi:hypothetical protein